MYTAQLSKSELQYFRQLMDSYNLSRLIRFVEPYLERCILLEISEQDTYNQVGNTRRCGWPDFPPGWNWPLSEQGQYLNFLSQINLGDIVAFQDVLPRSGILYFFVGGYESNIEGQIRYYDGDYTKLSRFVLPEPIFPEQFSLGFRPDLDEDDSFLLHNYPRRIKYHTSLSIPGYHSRVLTDQMGVQLGKKLSISEIRAYSEVREQLMYPTNIYLPPLPGFYEPSIHQRLFGYQSLWGRDSRDLGKIPTESFQIGVDLFSIWDHDEFFQTCLDGTIGFAVKQDELKHCIFSEVFVTLE